MSNRAGGSRRYGDDQRRRSGTSRGDGSSRQNDWEDDGWGSSSARGGASSSRGGRKNARYDDYAEEDYPRRSSSRNGGSSRAASARDARGSYTDDAWSAEDARGDRLGDQRWDAPEASGPANWNDPRYGGAARGGVAVAKPSRAGRSAAKERGGLPVRGIVFGLLSVLLIGALGYGVYYLLNNSRAQSSHPTAPVVDAPFTTYTPGPSPTVTANFKQFASTRSHYSVDYPSTWNTQSDQGTVQQLYDYNDVFSPPNSPSHVSIEEAGAFAYYTEQKIIQGEVANAQQKGFTFTEVTTTQTTQTVGGAQWQRREYDINANGQPLHMAILVTHHGGKGYVIVLVSSAAEFGNDAQAVFEPMLKSFRFV